MAKIRQFNILHYNKVSKMLESIAPDERLSLLSCIFGFPSDIIQLFLPLNLRKTPESYIAIKNENEVKAFITLEAAKGNKKKWFVKQLFLNKNSFDEGSQLIDFVISKYGALGADTFCVLLDENDETSSSLFAKNCGFRLCSREVIWKLSDIDQIPASKNKIGFQPAKLFDKKEITNFYNDCLEPHFRFSLEKEPSEFQLFLNKKFHQTVLKEDNNQIISYCNISNINNGDILIDLIVNKGYEQEYFTYLQYFVNFIKKSYGNNVSNIFVLNRNYLKTAKLTEEILQNNNFQRVQTKILLVKDFYKPIKSTEKIVNPAVIFNEINSKPAFF